MTSAIRATDIGYHWSKAFWEQSSEDPRLTVAFLFALISVLPLLSQEPRASIRIIVQADAVPVPGAIVSFSGVTMRTDRSGTAISPVSLGNVEVLTEASACGSDRVKTPGRSSEKSGRVR